MATTRPSSILVIRRALGSARDRRLVAELCAAAGVDPEGLLPESAESATLVLVAERQGEGLGLALVRMLCAFVNPPARDALLEGVFVREAHRRQGIGTALAEAAVAESEARGVRCVRVLADARDASAQGFVRALGFLVDANLQVYARTLGEQSSADASMETASLDFALAPGVRARLEHDPALGTIATTTLWSGAQAVRTRWTSDLSSPGWTTEGCVGSRDEGADVLRFDAATRRLRETYLTRPRALRLDAALLAAIEAAPLVPGVVTLAPDAPDFVCPSADEALFDTGLACLAGVRASLIARGHAEGLQAVVVSDHVALLVADGCVQGWRVLDPVAHVRPMGWPEARRGVVPAGERRARLAGLLYDWMVIDATAFVPPDEARDPEEIAHLVALRERARALAAQDSETRDDDPTSGVARDLAAHVHWSWGFFRVGE